MKTQSPILIICICLVVLLSQCSKTEVKCTIKGTLHGVDSKSVLIVETGKDFRFDAIEIPVENRTFLFDTVMTFPVGCTLFFKREGGSAQPFFMEDGTVFMDIYPENEFYKNRINGGPLNEEMTVFNETRKERFLVRYQPINDSIRELVKNGEYLSDTMNAIMEKLKKTKTHDEKIVFYHEMDKLREAGLDLSQEGKKWKAKSNEIREAQLDWEKKYIGENLSLVSYDLLLMNLMNPFDQFDTVYCQQTYKKFAKKYPDHPYALMAGNLINSRINIKPGGRYIDFTAPDLDGNSHTLSKEINGKFALIDLWATWCGPCIATSRSMVPVYEEFKEHGFTIVGVAGEFKNTNNLAKRLEKEQFPWLNLVELDRQNHLWEKYGIPNAGGRTFLVDKQGIILAVNPSANEVKEILNNKLNN